MSQPTAATSFGALIRRLRLASGLTQAALAERADLSERTIVAMTKSLISPWSEVRISPSPPYQIEITSNRWSLRGHWTRDQKSPGFLIYESTPGTRARHVVRGQGLLWAVTKGILC